MKKNKLFIILGVVVLLGAIILTCVLLLDKDEKKSSNNEENTSSNSDLFFEERELIKDTYLTDDYNNKVLYENTIYVPKFMTRLTESKTIANYLYKVKDYTLQLNYNSYLTEDSLKKSFMYDEEYKKDGNYYIYVSDSNIKVYFLNSNNIYQTIEIRIYSNTDEEYKLDNSYKNLLKNLENRIVDENEYSITDTDGYYKDYLTYNSYENEDNKYTVKIDYNVPSSKYGCNYDKELKYQELYLDESRISFYEGEITTDLNSVQAQTRIHMYINSFLNLDLHDKAVDELKWPLNQPAFNNVKESDVNIEIDTLKHNNKDVQYYKIISDNNNSHSERISAYVNIKDNLYYVINITGGVNKNLDINMINDFLPTNIVIE